VPARPRDPFKANRKVYGAIAADAAEGIADLLQLAEDVVEHVFLTGSLPMDREPHKRHMLALAVYDRIADRVAPRLAFLDSEQPPAVGPTPPPAPSPAGDADLVDFGLAGLPDPPQDYTK